jgi:hypothetical protein
MLLMILRDVLGVGESGNSLLEVSLLSGRQRVMDQSVNRTHH